MIVLWNELPASRKKEYKRLILAFASLTDMFAQKASDGEFDAAPIINSKYQETAFQRAFRASAEDIGNTSYDASVQYDGEKYLVGIKTFGIASGDQKVAQFKAKHDEWAQIIEEIKCNANKVDSKDEINQLNLDLYAELAKKIAIIRNERIDSSYANIKGFRIEGDDSNVHSVYHVLMPSSKGEKPRIYVGETSYDKIDIDNIEILGCTGKNNPTNFFFKDGNHTYKYTSADSQLHMNFMNRDIVCEEWPTKYADDAYSVFAKIADMIYPETGAYAMAESKTEYGVDDHFKLNDKEPIESYCWTIWNKSGETELYSGFNSFYGTGSKIGKDQRKQRITKICEKFKETVEAEILDEIRSGLDKFLLDHASTAKDKAAKARLREYILKLARKVPDSNFENEIAKLLFRPVDEMYIPIPDSAHFHKEHPDFLERILENLEKEVQNWNCRERSDVLTLFLIRLEILCRHILHRTMERQLNRLRSRHILENGYFVVFSS